MKRDLITTGLKGYYIDNDIYIPVFDIPRTLESIFYCVNKKWYFTFNRSAVKRFCTTTYYMGELPFAPEAIYEPQEGLTVIMQLPYLVESCDSDCISAGFRSYRAYVVRDFRGEYPWVIDRRGADV